jgi:hypothetical protein
MDPAMAVLSIKDRRFMLPDNFSSGMVVSFLHMKKMRHISNILPGTFYRKLALICQEIDFL